MSDITAVHQDQRSICMFPSGSSQEFLPRGCDIYRQRHQSTTRSCAPTPRLSCTRLCGAWVSIFVALLPFFVCLLLVLCAVVCVHLCPVPQKDTRRGFANLKLLSRNENKRKKNESVHGLRATRAEGRRGEVARASSLSLCPSLPSPYESAQPPRATQPSANSPPRAKIGRTEVSPHEKQHLFFTHVLVVPEGEMDNPTFCFRGSRTFNQFGDPGGLPHTPSTHHRVLQDAFGVFDGWFNTQRAHGARDKRTAPITFGHLVVAFSRGTGKGRVACGPSVRVQEERTQAHTTSATWLSRAMLTAEQSTSSSTARLPMPHAES